MSAITQATRTFTIVPRGTFSLAAAAAFGFGPREAEARRDGVMRLAFCLDGFSASAGVVLTQDAAGVHGEVHGTDDVAAVERQVARILSLDHDGEAWSKVGDRDPVMGRLQAERPGARPVLFHSPYEAAAWSVISARVQTRQAAALRRQLAGKHGPLFSLAGEEHAAFPAPERLLALREVPGLPEEKVVRLRGIAEAALAGTLDPEALRALPPEDAMAALRRLRGIGPFYAGLIVVRATGQTDALPVAEPKVLAAAARHYGLDAVPDAAAFARLADGWRPFRTWACVLLRMAAEPAAGSPPA